jgi:hypothetical protein
MEDLRAMASPMRSGMDSETMSESGWSVRDNPIAGDCSSEAENSPRIAPMRSLLRKRDGSLPPLVGPSSAQGSALASSTHGDGDGDGDDAVKGSSCAFALARHLGSQLPAYQSLNDDDDGDDGDDDLVRRFQVKNSVLEGLSDHMKHDALPLRVDSYAGNLLQWSWKEVAVNGQRLGRGIEIFLLGSLLVLLVFAAMVTILNVSSPHGQDESLLLVPT